MLFTKDNLLTQSPIFSWNKGNYVIYPKTRFMIYCSFVVGNQSHKAPTMRSTDLLIQWKKLKKCRVKELTLYWNYFRYRQGW